MQYLKINRRSDFSCVIEFKTGETVIDPTCDFELVFTTGSGKKYVVSRANGQNTNCVINEGILTALFVKHNLGCGIMLCHEKLEYPNSLYPNGIQHLEGIFNVGTKLVNEIGADLQSTTVNGKIPIGDYNNLLNKPSVNGVTLLGDKNNDDLKLTMTFVSV